MVVRYTDETAHAVCDMVHLNNERMHSPQQLGATTLVPLARAVMRGGHRLLAPEPATTGRDRAIAARRMLPDGVEHLRSPAPYRVVLSAGILALRTELAR
jgi:hypothetical protein